MPKIDKPSCRTCDAYIQRRKYEQAGTCSLHRTGVTPDTMCNLYMRMTEVKAAKPKKNIFPRGKSTRSMRENK